MFAITHRLPTRRLTRTLLAALLLAALAAITLPARADSVIFNGSLESGTPTDFFIGGMSGGGYGVYPAATYSLLTAWFAGSLNTTYIACSVAGGSVSNICGPNTLSLAANPGFSPDGGDYVALSDGAQLSQAYHGYYSAQQLPLGDYLTLSFYQASGQELGSSGTSTDYFYVQFFDQTFSSAVMSTPSQGDSPWELQSFTFQNDISNGMGPAISFVSEATGSGAFALLDGITLTDDGPNPPPVPEPSSLVLLGTGLVTLAATAKRRLAA